MKDNENAICKDCKQQMNPKTGCLFSHIVINGEEYNRIKAGDSEEFGDNKDEGHICHSCNTGFGQYHHFGCSKEGCPKCKGQLLSCGCLFDADVKLVQGTNKKK